MSGSEPKQSDYDPDVYNLRMGSYRQGLAQDMRINDPINDLMLHITARLKHAELPDEQRQDRVNDDVQIDDQVQDLLENIIYDKVLDELGEYVSQKTLTEIISRFRKDLSSLGIRLTYDTTIGGE